MMKLALIREQDGDAAAQAFMETQVGHEKMRTALARLYLQRGDLAAARRLCLEWLEDPPPDKPGSRHGFLEILLEAAVAGEDRAEQTRLSEALFLDTGRFEYYRRLKGLVGEQEWAAFRPGFLQRIRQGQYWRVNLGELCVAEEMWEALLHFVAAHPESIGRYHDVLAPHFPRELSQMYEQLARATLAREMNRVAYQQVCNYLQQMQALGEGEHVSELVTEFRTQYKLRRALWEELDRTFGKSQP